MGGLTRVAMALTRQDIENAAILTDHFPGIRNRTHAVSTALAFLRFIIETIAKKPGTELLFRDEQGKFERIVLPGLESVKPWGSPARDSLR